MQTEERQSQLELGSARSTADNAIRVRRTSIEGVPFGRKRFVALAGAGLFGLALRWFAPENARAWHGGGVYPCEGFYACHCCNGSTCCDPNGCFWPAHSHCPSGGQCWYTCYCNYWWQCCDWHVYDDGGSVRHCICVSATTWCGGGC